MVDIAAVDEASQTPTRDRDARNREIARSLRSNRSGIANSTRFQTSKRARINPDVDTDVDPVSRVRKASSNSASRHPRPVTADDVSSDESPSLDDLDRTDDLSSKSSGQKGREKFQIDQRKLAVAIYDDIYPAATVDAPIAKEALNLHFGQLLVEKLGCHTAASWRNQFLKPQSQVTMMPLIHNARRLRLEREQRDAAHMPPDNASPTHAASNTTELHSPERYASHIISSPEWTYDGIENGSQDSSSTTGRSPDGARTQPDIPVSVNTPEPIRDVSEPQIFSATPSKTTRADASITRSDPLDPLTPSPNWDGPGSIIPAASFHIVDMDPADEVTKRVSEFSQNSGFTDDEALDILYTASFSTDEDTVLFTVAKLYAHDSRMFKAALTRSAVKEFFKKSVGFRIADYENLDKVYLFTPTDDSRLSPALLDFVGRFGGDQGALSSRLDFLERTKTPGEPVFLGRLLRHLHRGLLW